MIGYVKWFSPRKGYGILDPDDGGFYVHVHVSALERAGIVELKEGQKIKFDVVADERMNWTPFVGPRVVGFKV